MHIKRCMMHKCMIMKHLMHEGSYKDRKNQIKDQKSKSSTIGILPHPNGTIVWNECLMRSEMRVGRIRTRGKSIKNFLQLLNIFSQIWYSLQSKTSKKLKFLFSFDSFKSLKLRAIRSKMTKDTTMMTNNGSRSTRLFREGSSTMVLFFLRHGALRSYVTDHTAMVTSRNKLRCTQFSRMGPKQRLRLKCLSLHFLVSCVEVCTPICLQWQNSHQAQNRVTQHDDNKDFLHFQQQVQQSNTWHAS